MAPCISNSVQPAWRPVFSRSLSRRPRCAGPSVTIRVEGKAKTMVEEQRLATPDAPVPTSTGTCNGNTALGALHQAVAGDWSGNGTYGTEFVERIRDENYPLGATPDGWTFWVNNKEASSGPCDYTAQEGDQILYLVEPLRVRRLDVRESAGAAARAPSARARRARPPPSELTVVRYDTGGNAAPVEGARITGAGVDATTGADGKASVTFAQAGEVTLKADKPGLVRSAAEKVAVSAPGQPVTPAAPVARDTTAPVGRIRGIRDGQRFKRKRAPRTLRGSVSPDPSGLQAVKLSLNRVLSRGCQLYSPTRERFRPSVCGRQVNFRIGDRQDWSYLLPKRLGKGRYILDVTAIDKLGNRDRPVRGRSRVVFSVR